MVYDPNFLKEVKPLVDTDIVQQMKEYRQHKGTVTLDHCIDVASESYNLNKKFHLNCDVRVLVKGALLHDFNLYDQNLVTSHSWHLVHHPQIAMNNAIKYFDVDKKTQQVIRDHMWPVTFWHIPHSREAWVVCVADKICFASELYFKRGARDGKR